ncbi:lysostaphin resistance A-like protein [Anatilimnocola sp. NA78]|uniref:CPBP family intramembrane glutamic endopeptidase n=1 Tax=Anatilimnocola sp. NA78 TaxID=3415683 RepID=UPI003CE55455
MQISWSPAQRFVFITVLFEGGLAAIALVAGWLLGFSPWYGMQLGINDGAHDFVRLTRDVLWGVFATAPAVLMLMVGDGDRWQPLRAVKDQVTEMLGRYLRDATALQLLLIAGFAGFGEELLFRGLIQAGLAEWLPGPWALIGSLAVASILFGLCHYLSHTYFALATLAGAYFGLLMIVSGSVLPAMVAHALYDFVALVYLASESREG